MTVSAPTIALFKKVNHVKTYRVLTHILRNGREENPPFSYLPQKPSDFEVMIFSAEDMFN